MGSSNTSGAAAGPVSVPVGLGFRPTDEELVDHYLRNKLQGMDSHIPEINLCKYDPSELPGNLFLSLIPTHLNICSIEVVGCGLGLNNLFCVAYCICTLLGAQTQTETHDMELFCCSRRDYKYTKSTRSNRTTPKGFWKATGKERAIRRRRSKVVIGMKRTLTFYEGRASGSPKPKKTNWVKHEYYLIDTKTNQAKVDILLYRLKNKSEKKDTSIRPEGELGNPIVSNSESQAAGDMTPEPQENGESLFHPLQPQEYSSSTLQSPIELGDVLQANGNSDGCNELQSPFGDNGSSLTDRNDISPCDEGEAPSSYTVFDFENQVANNLMMEQFAQPKENLDSLFYQQAIQQSPIMQPFGQPENNLDSLLLPTQPHQSQNYYSSTLQSQIYCFSTLQSQIYTNLGNFPLANVCQDECSNWQFPFANSDSYLTNKNNITTNHETEPVSTTALIFGNQATNYRISEVFPQPEENLESLFQPLQPQDYTLQTDTEPGRGFAWQ